MKENNEQTLKDQLTMKAKTIDLAFGHARQLHENRRLDSRLAAHVKICVRDGVLSSQAHEGFVDDLLTTDNPPKEWIYYTSLSTDRKMARAYDSKGEVSLQYFKLEQATRTAKALEGRKDQQDLLSNHRQILLNAVTNQVRVAAGHLPGINSSRQR